MWPSFFNGKSKVLAFLRSGDHFRRTSLCYHQMHIYALINVSIVLCMAHISIKCFSEVRRKSLRNLRCVSVCHNLNLDILGMCILKCTKQKSFFSYSQWWKNLIKFELLIWVLRGSSSLFSIFYLNNFKLVWKRSYMIFLKVVHGSKFNFK